MAQEAVKLNWTDVGSSNVQSVAYDPGTETLCVRFLNGGLYTYDHVDEHVYVDLVHAESVGKYLNYAVKGSYLYTKWSSEKELINDLLTRKHGRKGEDKR